MYICIKLFLVGLYKWRRLEALEGSGSQERLVILASSKFMVTAILSKGRSFISLYFISQVSWFSVLYSLTIISSRMIIYHTLAVFQALVSAKFEEF